MDIAVKIFQIFFYIIGSSIAILTYIKAKNGLLNSINTEYQKRVMDRLSQLATEIYEEFDSNSEKYWGNEDEAKEILSALHEKIIPKKEQIIQNGTPILEAMLVPAKLIRLKNFLEKIKSDPFIPKKIRQQVVDLLDNRISIMIYIFMKEFENYKTGLKEGKYWDTLDTNHHWFHNKVIDSMYKSGCGISQIEKSIHQIRNEIQDYFESFDPIKK